MPRIPSLNQNQVAPQALPSVRIQQPATGGLQALGDSLGYAGNVVQKVRAEEQLKADRVAFMESDRLLGESENSLLHDPQSGAFTKQGKDAFDISNKTLEEFDKAATKAQEGLTTDRQRLVFREALQQRRQGIQRQLQTYEGGQREAYYAGERKAYVESAAQSAVLNYQDPTRIESELDKVRATIDQMPGLSDEQRAQSLASVRGNVYTDVISRYLANGQTKQAQDYYGKVKSNLTGDQLVRVDSAMLQAKKAAEAAAKKATVDRYSASIMGEYSKFGPEAGAAALAKIEKLPPDIRRDIYAQVNSDQARIREVTQQQFASQLANINSQISTDTTTDSTQTEIDLLWNKGAFSPQEYASLTSRVEASKVQGATNAAATAVIRQSLETGQPIDPSNTKVMKALDGAFAQDVLNTKPGSESWQFAAGAYATRTRALPTQALAWARSSLRSPDAAVAARAAQFLGGVDASAPDAMGQVDQTTRAMASTINDLIQSGTDPEAAVTMARDRILDANPAIVKQRADAYKAGGTKSFAANSSNALKSFVDRDFDTWLTKEPAITSELDVAFRSQSEQYYVRTGDINKAHELAWKDLKRVYGPSKVNGEPQLMAFPPENFGISPDDVRRDVGQFLIGEESPQQVLARNAPYAKSQQSYLTKLPADEEKAFQQWVKDNNVPFDPSPTADYDMRGFYKAMKAGDPRASTGINANDGKLHFGDYWKTPYHHSFSSESQWATDGAPRWNEKDQLVTPDGKVVFDEPGLQKKYQEAAAGISVVPDALTQRQVSSALSGESVRPSYRLVTKDGDLVVDSKGRPIRYIIPSSDDLSKRIQEAQQKAADEAKQTVDKARQQREDFIKQMDEMVMREASGANYH